MPFWAPVAIAGFVAGGIVFGYIVSARRERAKLKREAARKFRSAFGEAMTQFDNVDAYFYVTEARAQHDAAILEFRPFVELTRVELFDEAVQIFFRCRNEIQPAPAKVLASLSSGKPLDNSDTYELKKALFELLAFADNANCA